MAAARASPSAVKPAGLNPTAIEQRLLDAVPLAHSIQVEDVSDGHTSTASALASGQSQRAGGLEFKITIVSETFEGLPPLERQRVVYDALRPELESGEIHSLPLMRVWTPEQLAKCQQRGLDSRCTALLARSLSGKEREATLQATREAAASTKELASIEHELRSTQEEILRHTPPSSPSAKVTPSAASSNAGVSLEAEVPCECGEATVAQAAFTPPTSAVETTSARFSGSTGELDRSRHQKLPDKLLRQVASDTCA